MEFSSKRSTLSVTYLGNGFDFPRGRNSPAAWHIHVAVRTVPPAIDVVTREVGRQGLVEAYCISGRGLGHVTQIRNLGTPIITFERIEIPASNFAQT